MSNPSPALVFGRFGPAIACLVLAVAAEAGSKHAPLHASSRTACRTTAPLTWAQRLKRVFEIDITLCPLCGGQLRVTLAAVVEYYDIGGTGDPMQDPRIRRLDLSAEDKTALVAFLQSLTGSDVHALAADARSVRVGDSQQTAQRCKPWKSSITLAPAPSRQRTSRTGQPSSP